jgi:predicted metallopeptidase
MPYLIAMVMKAEVAPDVQDRLEEMLQKLHFHHIDVKRIISMRSKGAKTDAMARIWSLPKIWQQALGVEPHYVIEVVSERFDKIGDEEKERVLIHELLHIPKTFSGALVPHTCFGKKIDEKRVDEIYKNYKAVKESEEHSD